MDTIVIFGTVTVSMFIGVYIGWFMGYSARRDDEVRESRRPYGLRLSETME
jgi:ABC-type dipeptide/oligopeptide/nickel transport system permease subunit